VKINNSSGGGVAITSGKTQVFASAAAPNVWTDLDLSAVVGPRLALVIILIENTDVLNHRFGFRQNGEVELDAIGSVNSISGAGSGTELVAGAWGCVIVMTDSSGIVEWCSNAVGRTAALDVIGFIA